jgi:hypothetical protein
LLAPEEITMVARSHIPDDGAEDFFDPRLDPDRIEGIHIVTSREEAEAIFDRRVQYELSISGEEFLRGWYAGEYGTYAEIPDTTYGRRILRIVHLIPFVEAEYP